MTDLAANVDEALHALVIPGEVWRIAPNGARDLRFGSFCIQDELCRCHWIFSAIDERHIMGAMFSRRLSIQRIDAAGQYHPCPIHWIDNFAMRNFTNDAIFDDTLPLADGVMEAGTRVPLDRLRPAMEDWFRRKNYLKTDERLEIDEIPTSRGAP